MGLTVRIGAFEVVEPLPELREPHALAMLRPWVDVGSVGSLVLARLEAHFAAKELGRLVRPGSFFDFTRYRPQMYFEEGRRQVAIPNSFVTYAKRERGNDFLFLHLLEPHMLGEVYAAAVLRLLERLAVKRYCLLGSMYDVVPHTRPLIVTGGTAGGGVELELKQAGVRPSDYEGPTTIAYLISQRAAELGIETMTIIVHLPQYAQVDEDYMGQARLMEVLGSLYPIPRDEADIQRAEQQRRHLDLMVEGNPRLKEMMAYLEGHYDAPTAERKEEEVPQLPPEVEKFITEMDRRFREG